MNKILIVEDETKIARIIDLQLRHEGYETSVATDGETAIKKIEQGDFDLVLLDIMMPTMDGLETCKHIKQCCPEIKVIFLTAKDDISDVIIGLDTGADDYVTKPFVFDELLARVRANIRKNASARMKQEVISLHDLEMNLSTFEVTRGDVAIELSKTEFNLLSYLVKNKEIVFSREMILEKVWGYSYFGSPNVVDVYIKYIRDKIDKNFEPKIIYTVRGRGYVAK